MLIEKNKKHINFNLQRISNILLINGGFLDIPGLYSGEMGLVLFFFYYADYTEDEAYWDYAFELLERVQDRIHKETSIDYKNGLAGIGSAIEFLVQEGFIEADTDEILEDFDERIFSFENMTHLLTIDELLGIGYYALRRMAGHSVRTDMILKKVLPKLVSLSNEMCRNLDFEYRTILFIKDIIETENPDMLSDMSISFRPCRNCYPYGLEINIYNRYLEQFSKNVYFEKNTLNLGLQNGLAGFGMALITEYEGDNSWISLFPKDLNYIKNESLPL